MARLALYSWRFNQFIRPTLFSIWIGKWSRDQHSVAQQRFVCKHWNAKETMSLGYWRQVLMWLCPTPAHWRPPAAQSYVCVRNVTCHLTSRVEWMCNKSDWLLQTQKNWKTNKTLVRFYCAITQSLPAIYCVHTKTLKLLFYMFLHVVEPLLPLGLSVLRSWGTSFGVINLSYVFQGFGAPVFEAF
jgi:hypothetical protein